MESLPLPVAVPSVHIENVRGFASLDLELGESALIIGRNGTNKTTLLRVLAMVLSDEPSASGLLSQPVGQFVRANQEFASIEVVVTVGRYTVRGRRVIRSVGVRESTATGGTTADLGRLPVFAYGAGRGVVGGDSGRALSSGMFGQLVGLFDYREPLEDPELTLRRLEDYLGDEVYHGLLRSLRRLLELGDQDEIRVARGGGVALSGPSVGGTVPLEAWADGHRLTLSWLLDLFGKAMRSEAIDREGNITGVLLIDEIDQHLHPALQATIFGHLRNLLPKMQIIATTHSPLVALSVDPSALIVLRPGPDGVVVDQAPRDYRGYTVEDMLADDRLFDAPVMGPEAQAQLDRYNHLLAKGNERSEPEEAELAAMAASMVAEPPPPEVADDLDATIAEIRHRLSS